ncbi:type II toxin-antitoxin system RelE/ParE family toxin [Streptomyces sp. NPDC046862]|uniref:type II toxin-antitoxin system RelE family toxin n=1 Tax=Streptomyces sp. NPDC046862 TaxID=3154603 RepID=UPI003456F2D3
MTFRTIWHEQATNAAVRFLKEDPDGLRQVFVAVDLLAEDPRPAGTTALGSPDLRRMHVGPYRLMYQIEDDSITVVVVLHIGRVP